jgi:hypothetical protein
MISNILFNSRRDCGEKYFNSLDREIYLKSVCEYYFYHPITGHIRWSLNNYEQIWKSIPQFNTY